MSSVSDAVRKFEEASMLYSQPSGNEGKSDADTKPQEVVKGTLAKATNALPPPRPPRPKSFSIENSSSSANSSEQTRPLPPIPKKPDFTHLRDLASVRPHTFIEELDVTSTPSPLRRSSSCEIPPPSFMEKTEAGEAQNAGTESLSSSQRGRSSSSPSNLEPKAGSESSLISRRARRIFSSFSRSPTNPDKIEFSSQSQSPSIPSIPSTGHLTNLEMTDQLRVQIADKISSKMQDWKDLETGLSGYEQFLQDLMVENPDNVTLAFGMIRVASEGISSIRGNMEKMHKDMLKVLMENCIDGSYGGYHKKFTNYLLGMTKRTYEFISSIEELKRAFENDEAHLETNDGDRLTENETKEILEALKQFLSNGKASKLKKSLLRFKDEINFDSETVSETFDDLENYLRELNELSFKYQKILGYKRLMQINVFIESGKKSPKENYIIRIKNLEGEDVEKKATGFLITIPTEDRTFMTCVDLEEVSKKILESKENEIFHRLNLPSFSKVVPERFKHLDSSYEKLKKELNQRVASIFED